MAHAEVLLQLLLDVLIFLSGPVDGIGHTLALGGILFQLPGKFHTDLIRFAVSVDDSVYDVDHLIENLFYDRVTKSILREDVQSVLVFPAFDFLFGERSLGVPVSGLGAGFAVFHAFFHMGKYPAHGLCA